MIIFCQWANVQNQQGIFFPSYCILGLFGSGLLVNILCPHTLLGVCLCVYTYLCVCLQEFIYRANSLGFKTRAMLLKVSHSQFPIAKLIFIPSFNRGDSGHGFSCQILFIFRVGWDGRLHLFVCCFVKTNINSISGGCIAKDESRMDIRNCW